MVNSPKILPKTPPLSPQIQLMEIPPLTLSSSQNSSENLSGHGTSHSPISSQSSFTSNTETAVEPDPKRRKLNENESTDTFARRNDGVSLHDFSEEPVAAAQQTLQHQPETAPLQDAEMQQPQQPAPLQDAEMQQPQQPPPLQDAEMQQPQQPAPEMPAPAGNAINWTPDPAGAVDIYGNIVVTDWNGDAVNQLAMTFHVAHAVEMGEVSAQLSQALQEVGLQLPPNSSTMDLASFALGVLPQIDDEDQRNILLEILNGYFEDVGDAALMPQPAPQWAHQAAGDANPNDPAVPLVVANLGSLDPFVNRCPMLAISGRAMAAAIGDAGLHDFGAGIGSFAALGPFLNEDVLGNVAPGVLSSAYETLRSVVGNLIVLAHPHVPVIAA